MENQRRRDSKTQRNNEGNNEGNKEEKEGRRNDTGRREKGTEMTEHR